MWSKTLQRPIPLTRSGIPAWRKKRKEMLWNNNSNK
jgi:hypothetical protein